MAVPMMVRDNDNMSAGRPQRRRAWQRRQGGSVNFIG
jgi:hypothetical protein